MKKYYKVSVEDLFSLSDYGLKRDWNQPAHVNNVHRLDDIYRIRYPLLMKRVEDLCYLGFRTKTHVTISKEEKAFYNVPDYFLVSPVEENGIFEYTELLTGVSFLLPTEIYYVLDKKTCDLKEEIGVEELINLFNDDYIEKISNLFNITYNNEKKETAKKELVKSIK